MKKAKEGASKATEGMKKAKIFMATVMAFIMTTAVSAFASGTTPPTITSIVSGINLTAAFSELYATAGVLLTDLLPLGMGLMLLIMVPKLVGKVVRSLI